MRDQRVRVGAVVAWIWLATTLAACTSEEPETSDGGIILTSMFCIEAADCDDGITCTTDGCVNNLCVSTPENSACPSGNVCVATLGCRPVGCTDADQMVCNGSCINFFSDSNNCGNCGLQCGEDQTCLSGHCACDGSQTTCNDGCADLTTSQTDCGSCGNTCPASTMCLGGVCVCGAGMADCGLGCIDILSDTHNCGGCDVACPAGVACSAGACACPTGTTVCSAVCVNTATDPANCGSCGTACLGGAVCLGGHCGCASPTPTLCASTCTSVASDSNNCGACGVACTGGMTCTGGVCGCPATASADCGGTCSNLTTDANNCGACGTVCVGACIVGGCAAITGVTAGYRHACALVEDSTVRCWGSDEAGQLGGAVTGVCTSDGGIPCALSPTPVTGLSGVVEVAAGAYHTCARSSDGTVRCWGMNDAGQLGYSTTTNCLATFGSVPCSMTPTVVAGLANVAQLALGGDHTCARLTDGTVTCWGDNGMGELGASSSDTCTDVMEGSVQCARTPTPVPELTGVVSLVAGQTHTCALKSDGTMWCWGANDAGQIGTTTGTDCLGTLGIVASCASTPTQVPGLSGVVAIGAGAFHTCAVLAGGTVACWGDDTDGSLGTSTSTLCIMHTGQQVGCIQTPTAVTGLIGVAAIALGETQACARLTNGSVQCWGDAINGLLGTGTTPDCSALFDGATGICSLIPLPVPGLSNVVALTAGNDETCALGMDGGLRCWGLNATGEIGNGTVMDSNTPTLVTF